MGIQQPVSRHISFHPQQAKTSSKAVIKPLYKSSACLLINVRTWFGNHLEPKTAVQDPPRTNGWKLAHCSPSNKWGPSGNIGEIKGARKGTGHPTQQCQWPRTSFLSNRHLPTYNLYMGLTFYKSSNKHLMFVCKLSNDIELQYQNTQRNILDF